jgi:hypothetical protein
MILKWMLTKYMYRLMKVSELLGSVQLMAKLDVVQCAVSYLGKLFGLQRARSSIDLELRASPHTRPAYQPL